MTTTRTHVVLAGAGIGGLTAALGLHAAGHRVTVVDRVRRVAPLGVGVNLQPPAVGVLVDLGLDAWLAEHGVDVGAHVYLDDRGRHRYTEPRGTARDHPHPQVAVHRGALQTELLARVLTRCGADAVRLGTPVTGADRRRDGVRVHLADRATGAASWIDADALVGADGLHSAVRAALHPDGGGLRHSGTVMWRGTTEAPRFLDGYSMVLARDEHGTQLVAYPIRPPTGPRRTVVNWVVQVPRGEPGPVRGSIGWNRPGRAEDVLPAVRDWDLGVLDVADLVARAGAILELPMVDRDPLPAWGAGRVTLLGDAAHPMYPVGANGATQAILDARALTGALAGGSDPGAALATYEHERRAPTAAIVLANREMDRAERGGAVTDPAAVTERYRHALRGGV